MVKKIIRFGIIGLVVIVVGGFAYLYFTGGVDKQATEDLARRTVYQARGAVQEGLTAKSAPGDANSAEMCRQNLRRIEQGKRVIAQRKGAAVGAVSKTELEEAVGGSMPRCPDGGRYKINDIGMLPTCSKSAQRNQDPSDDHVILQF